MPNDASSTPIRLPLSCFTLCTSRPVTITSARFALIRSNASPIAFVADAQAVATAVFGPFSPQNTEIFPNMVIQMVSIGEESGALDGMLGKVADFYEAEVDDAVDALSSLMEPMIMVVLGTLIGGMVIAMYLPIFKMGQVVG